MSVEGEGGVVEKLSGGRSGSRGCEARNSFSIMLGVGSRTADRGQPEGLVFGR